MRLSVLALAAVLLIPTIVVAQHPGTAPSTPPPSPPPSAAPSPSAPAPAPSPAPSNSPSPAPSAPSPSASHSSAASAPPPASAPESHVAPVPSPSSGRASGSSATELNSGRAAPAPHAPESDARRIIPDQKISGESRIVAAPRIGEKAPEKEVEPKKDESDLRHGICANGPCKEPAPKPEPPESDLRRRICAGGLCPCPSGQTATKGGCVATAVTPPAPCEPGSISNGVDCTPAISSCPPGQVWNGANCMPSAQCPAGEVWNGTSCILSRQCPAGEVWNGLSCVAATDQCISFQNRAAPMIAELRNLRSDVQQACGQNPSGQNCMDLKQDQQLALDRYTLLWNEAPVECRTTFLPDPETLI